MASDISSWGFRLGSGVGISTGMGGWFCFGCGVSLLSFFGETLLVGGVFCALLVLAFWMERPCFSMKSLCQRGVSTVASSSAV